MSSCVAELDAILQSMLIMKAPGVSGSKISSITQLCNANIQVGCLSIVCAKGHDYGYVADTIDTQSESVLIQKIYTHFKKAPGTHKLGVLYVVDSVTRSWVEQARKAGQQPGPSAAYGTYGAGVYRVTELLPMLMTDITNSAPEDQKVRSISRIFPSHVASCIRVEDLHIPLLGSQAAVIAVQSSKARFKNLGILNLRMTMCDRLESRNSLISGSVETRFQSRCSQISSRS